MTRIIGLLFIIYFHNTGFCDTITNWQVYHNDRLLDKFNILNLKNEIVFKKSDLKNGDSITINYFRDTPCFDCLSFLNIVDEKQSVITYEGKGTFTPKKIPMDKLIESEKDYFEVWYHESESKSRTERLLLFKIKLE